MALQLALIFDVDGTIVNNMPYHLKAWSKLIAELGSDLKGDELLKQLYGKNEEVLKRIFGKRFSEDELHKLSLRKEEYYRELYLPHMQLVPGVREFLEDAKQHGIAMAIGTASMKTNLDLLLYGLNIHEFFNVVITADDVTRSKPDPETYLLAAQRLNMEPRHCIVFEDVPKGVEAAANGSMKCIVVTTNHLPEEFEPYKNIIQFIADFRGLKVEEIRMQM